MGTLIAILNLLPAILTAVQAVEAAVPVPAAGKAKLDLVLSTVQTVYTADQQLQKQIPSDQLVGIITSTVGSIVANYNALGMFKKAK